MVSKMRIKKKKNENPPEQPCELLPLKIMEFLREGEDREIHLGEQRNICAAVLTVNTRSFLDMVQERHSMVFVQVNQLLNQLIPIVLGSRGVIDRFLGGGLSAFYPEKPEAALKAMIEIGEIINSAVDEPHCSVAELSMGISYGPVMVGIVGNDNAFTTVTVSEDTGLSEFLQRIGRSYYARALVSESYARHLGDFRNQYECRFLGYLHVEGSQKLEKIYDLYQVDTQDVRWLKNRTKLMFEEGVRLFANKSFRMARKHFVEVLRINRDDAAARKYLFLCEQYLESGSDGNIYFESY